jgi:hypothetical protein
MPLFVPAPGLPAGHDNVETRVAAMPRIRFDFGALVLEAEVLDTPTAGPM